MKPRHTHTRDFLVPVVALENDGTMKPRQFFCLIERYVLPRAQEALTLRGGLEFPDGDSMAVYLEAEFGGLRRLGVIHFLGLFADDQSCYRFAVADMTHDSVLVAAARHAANLGAPLHEVSFAAKDHRPIPAGEVWCH